MLDATIMKMKELQFLQLLMDTIPMPVFYKDVNGVYLGHNKAFEQFLGLPKDRIIGKTVYDVAPKELADEYHQKDKELFDSPGIQVYEFSVKYADGTLHDVIFNKATYTDAQGYTAGLIGVMQDITERKKTEENLRLLKQSIDIASDAVFWVDPEAKFVYVNDSACKSLGYDHDELMRMRLFDVDPLSNPSDWSGLWKQIREQKKVQIETIHLRKDGSEFPVEILSSYVKFGDKEYLCGFARDITERKNAEKVIQRNYDTQTAINWVLSISLKDISLESILKQTLDLLLSIPWLAHDSRGSIFLVEDEPDTMVMKAQRGLSGHVLQTCAIVPFGACLCGRAAARREVQFTDAVDERHEIRYDDIAPHGHYCVPIMHAKTVLGVINLYLKEGHREAEREIEFLNAIASALAGIIQRKRTEEERERLIGDLRTVLDAITRSYKELP